MTQIQMNGYILIGGRSRRMGRSKIDLPFRGKTLLERTLDVARGVFDRVVAVQRHGAAPLPTVETLYENPHEGEAPLFGVQRALEDTSGKCFILAIDYPLLVPGVALDLAERFGRSAAPLLVPEWNGKPQMLCGGYSRELLPRIESRIANGRLDLRGLIDECGGEIVAETELRARYHGEPLMNVNTPEELAEAEKIDEKTRLLSSR